MTDTIDESAFLGKTIRAVRSEEGRVFFAFTDGTEAFVGARVRVAEQKVLSAYKGELYGADPTCKHEVVAKEMHEGGGVKCRKCRGWFCH